MQINYAIVMANNYVQNRRDRRLSPKKILDGMRSEVRKISAVMARKSANTLTSKTR